MPLHDLGLLFIHIDGGGDCLNILIDSIEALLTLSRLLIPRLADGLEYIAAFKLASVGLIVYSDSMVQVDTQIPLLFRIFLQHSVVTLLIPMLRKGLVNTFGYQSLIR